MLAQTPTFQTGWFNKGNYLAEKARIAEQDGSAKVAKAAYADARAAYEKAVALGADSASGQQAQQRLDALPQLGRAARPGVESSRWSSCSQRSPRRAS